jgi:hypothetical protein
LESIPGLKKTKNTVSGNTVLRIPIRKFWGPPDPDPYFYGRIRILPSTSKKFKKILISTVLCRLLDSLSLKPDVKVPIVSNKEENLFFLGLLKPLEKEKNPDPKSNSMGPRIRLRNKTSRIRNTAES